MDAKTFEDARQHLDKLMDQSADNAEPIIVTRTGIPAVVLLSLDEWNRMQEMLLLIRWPANRDRLDRAIRDARCGPRLEQELLQLGLRFARCLRRLPVLAPARQASPQRVIRLFAAGVGRICSRYDTL